MHDNPFRRILSLSFQAFFENEVLVLICKFDSEKDLTITLYYKHENDDSFQKVDLRNNFVVDKSDEYRVEHVIANAKTGNYICKIQSKCEYGMSEISTEQNALKENEVITLLFDQYSFSLITSFA